MLVLSFFFLTLAITIAAACQCPQPYPYCASSDAYCYRSSTSFASSSLSCAGSCTSDAPRCTCSSGFPYCATTDGFCYASQTSSFFSYECGGSCAASGDKRGVTLDGWRRAALAAFEDAKAQWISRPKVLCCQTPHSLILKMLCHGGDTKQGMVPSPFAHPEPEKCEGKIVRFGGKGDGGWDVCMDHTVIRHDGDQAERSGSRQLSGGRRCAAYLIGAGTDITFDMEFAAATKCDVFTIDPTPGLAQRLSSRRGIASLLHQKRKALIERILTNGPPPNWRHINVGLAASDSTARWQTKRSWANSHVRFLNVTSVDPTVQLQSVQSLMTSLGHASVRLVKMDAEGAEWQVAEQLVAQTKMAQLVIEVHTLHPNAHRLFGFYELMMRHGLSLMGQQNMRYVNGNKQLDNWFVANAAKLKRAGLPKRAPFVFRHVRYSNGTMCENALGEFHFYRPPSVAIAPVTWRYTSVEYQHANE